MKKNLLFTFSAVLIFVSSFGQGSLWNKTTEDRVKNLSKMDRASMPREYQLFSLDFNALKAQLLQAPSENVGSSNVIVDFPNQNGEFTSYKIFDAPVMEAGLANKYPDIKSYTGVSVDGTSSIRFSTTIFGLHVMSLTGSTGTYYIDTYTKDLENYIVYGRNNISSGTFFSCLNPDEELAPRLLETSSVAANDGRFRQYRLAMACTIEYAAFHINAAGVGAGTLAQKKAAVLAAMNVTMTRVNGLYERDMSLRMNLVANNDLVIFVDSDNFDNDTASTLINESQVEINAAIGSANYDIGHTVSTGGGGLAQLNSPCTANKARGITGSSSPVGDPFDIDYVAHEMGHQFGAGHTQNNDCNRAAGTAVETGSGNTIMGYAGICPPDVQSNSDAHFHTVSLNQMMTFTTSTGNCAPNALNGNTPPAVNAGVDRTIPKGTPFILFPQSVTDANGDSLTYCWEQTDNAVATQPPAPGNTSGPSFRSNPPVTAPERYMPALATVVAGSIANTWEVVSTAGRTYNFALTVRDNRMPNGGQTTRDNVVVTASNTIGPFSVSSQNATVGWAQGSTQTITWVRNGAETLSANVDIYLSTDGGVTFPTLLTPSGVPNSGSATITVPNVVTQTARIMVRAKENIFYAVNSKNILIGYSVTNNCVTYPFNTAFSPVDGSTGYTIRTISVPTSTSTISDVNINVNATHPNIQHLSIAVVRPGGGTPLALYSQGCASGANMNVTWDAQGSALTCASPTQGTYIPVGSLDSMNGFNPSGTWQMGFRDLVAGTTGTINSFSIEICSQTITALATDNFSFDNFALYPNPNDGTFTVKFNSNTGNDINVAVYDMRGRSIFNNVYQNNGVFEQILQLDNVQSGIYLVNIQDGEKKIVKKIVVE